MPKNYFSPKFGRFGVMSVVVSQAAGSSPMTANSSESILIPTPPGKFVVLGATAVCTTIAIDADGTALAYITKRVASDDSDVVLTAGLDLEAMTVLERTEFVVNKQPGSASNIFLAGDVLKMELVSNSASIDTEPVNLVITVELGYLE